MPFQGTRGAKRSAETVPSSIKPGQGFKCITVLNGIGSYAPRAWNMVVHGLPDTAAVSNPAALEPFVKDRVDSVQPNRGSSPSQSITTVTCSGRPGTGNKAVLVEYASRQAKHKTHALSKQLRQQGISLTDELTPKQQQAQKSLDPDRIALQSKRCRTWFRHGTLWYLDQGVPKSANRVRLSGYRKLRALHLGPTFQLPGPHPGVMAAAQGRLLDALEAASQQAPLELTGWLHLFLLPPRLASQAASPSYAFVAGSDPVTAMYTAPAAPVDPAAGPTSAAAAAPSCTPTSTPPFSLISSPAGPPAPTCSHQPPIGGC